jgi:D-serine deaminase-like pyridoxal phosphate-dependent protein
MRAFPPARVGDRIAAVESPALVVDLAAMERNLMRMSGYAASKGLRLRPHAKTHKCAAIARRQIELGAVGVCVQKLDEALALGAFGIDNILITNEIVARSKLERLAQLARNLHLGVAVDSALGVELLAKAMKAQRARIDVYVEVDVGQGRCGVPSEQAGQLARLVSQYKPLRLAGLQAYHGRVQHQRSHEERDATVSDAAQAVQQAKDAVRAEGLEVPLVTGGGTGAFALESESGLWGELQAGSYVFMDRDYADNLPTPHAPQFEHSLFIKSQVISRGTDHAVIDAGHKSHALDSGPPRVWMRRLDWRNGGDEHGILTAREGESLPALGDTVWLVPGHCDPTVNLHDHIVAVRGGLQKGAVEAVWTVDARGCLA